MNGHRGRPSQVLGKIVGALTWPPCPHFPFDNIIIFGETSLAVGVLLFGVAFYGCRRGPRMPWIEASFLSALNALVGVGAVIFPFALQLRSWATKVVGCT